MENIKGINIKYNIGDTVYFADRAATYSVVELTILSIIIDNDGVSYETPGKYGRARHKEHELYATYGAAQNALDDEKLLTMRLTELKEALTNIGWTVSISNQLSLFNDIHRLVTKLDKSLDISIL